MRESDFRPLPETRVRMLRQRVLAWYDAHARALPWRQPPATTENRDPYRVWVSEVMLQQTRVVAMIEHYHEFLHRFPKVEKLAAAREASVLAAWSGLGYYRRARMMHRAAKMIMHELAGNFPETAAEWRRLPGVGRYTAAAISSIAFGEPVAVVDGNVERVLQRISGQRLAGEALWQAAELWLDRERPGDFNQALMELGATVCTPRAPMCLACPVIELCTTRGELSGATKLQPQKKREIHYVLDRCDGAVFLVQRGRDARLMPGMWELPQMERPVDQATPFLTVRHSITVTDYTVRVWRKRTTSNSRGRWIEFRRLPKLAITGLTRKILRRAHLM